MKKQLTNSERNILKGVAIAISLPVLINIAQGNQKTVGEIIEQENVVATIAATKAQEFNVSSLPEYCSPAFQRLSLETYTLCIHEGMSYVQVGNVIGNPGTNHGQSGNVSVWNWTENVHGESDGSMSATFINGKLASKAQYGLDSDRDFR